MIRILKLAGLEGTQVRSARSLSANTLHQTTQKQREREPEERKHFLSKTLRQQHNPVPSDSTNRTNRLASRTFQKGKRVMRGSSVGSKKIGMLKNKNGSAWLEEGRDNWISPKAEERAQTSG